jgi:uroporphyrinogen decarboxylase
LVLWGGIDKRVLSRSKKEIEHEVLSKVPELLKNGGYIPSIDHSVPPDVPFKNFEFYIDLIRRLTHKVCKSKID